jgi:hypothetical protein
MPLGLAHCVGDLILLQCHGTLQDHFDGGAYIEEEIMRVGEQH